VAQSVGAGVSEKLRRAHMHREDFEGQVDTFLYTGVTNAYTAVRDDDVEAGQRRWKVQVHRQPPLVEWGAVIGDCPPVWSNLPSGSPAPALPSRGEGSLS
jgi:hypothetical protein